MASNVSGGGGDITVEAWVNFYQLQQLVVFDLGEPAQNSGNLYLGLTGGGKPFVTIQGQYFTTNQVTPPTKQWMHFGVQLQTYGSVYFVNLLFNGAIYCLGQYTKNSVNWGSVLMLGQQLSGDYPLSGGISNVRVSTSAVYANPWTSVPLSYPLAFPLLADPSTVILLQGSGPSNTKNPLQSITELTQINSLYAPPLYSNLPPSLAGAMDLSSGWLYKSSLTITFTNLTMESWVYYSGSGSSTNSALFDTRLQQCPLDNLQGCAPYIAADGTLGIYSQRLSRLNPLGGNVSYNTWTHIAWVLNNGTWNAYINGILVGSVSNSSVQQASPIPQLGIGIACDNWTLNSYKFHGKVFQPMITASAKYVSNFVPANDLSVGASSLPVAFFMNPGVSGSLADLVTASSVPTYGTAVTTAPRYLSY